MGKTHRAAIIGLGFIGGGDQVSGDAIGGQQVANLDGTHVAALSKHPQVELVAGSSRDAGRRQRFERRTGVKTYADWQALLAAESPDIVSVATYAPVHAEITLACVQQGARAVYCEKPIATTLTDAERMAQACRAAGALLVINHNRRFNPNYRRLRDLIAEGGLGALTSASLRWGHGRLGNVGTHTIDALCLVTGRRVTAVSATLDLSGRADCRGEQFADPGGWGVMRMEGGLMATVDAADAAEGSMHIIVYGTEGRAVTGRDEVMLDYWDGRTEKWPSTRSQATSMDVAVAEIVAWLDGAAEFPYPATDALHTHETITAFHASHARNAAWTELPLTGPDREIEVRSG